MSWDDESPEYLFFSVSPTLGIVHEPVKVPWWDKNCFGWLGGNRGLKACCNKKWVVVAGTDTSTAATGLFVYKVENARVGPCCRVTKYPWIDSVFSLRFFGSSEYDFESDVVEAILFQEADENLMRVLHINVNTGSDNPIPIVIGECHYITEREVRAEWATQPLINRPDGTYYFMSRDYGSGLSVLVLNTGEIITLPESCPFLRHKLELKFDWWAVDELHLCVTNEDCSVASVYQIQQLLSSAPSPTFSLMAEDSSCFPSAHAGQVHHFVPGSMVAGGCGIIVSSALSMHSVQPGQRGVTLFKTKDPAAANFCSPRVQMYHQFIDAITGTLIFTMNQKRMDKALLPIYAKAVPFHSPLCD
ncbi:hypothetical protein Pelo_18768 [Pelomyxa schiedti]|nr:hypothetical protein Pelo_18768 [Pelomyxa schiedti]